MLRTNIAGYSSFRVTATVPHVSFSPCRVRSNRGGSSWVNETAVNSKFSITAWSTVANKARSPAEQGAFRRGLTGPRGERPKVVEDSRAVLV